eukprot:8260871-Ditylum_brightwellii.AAC.1
MVSEDKPKGDTTDGTKKQTNPKFQPLAAGRPNWCIYCGELRFWCNVCGYWNATHITTRKEGMKVLGYLDNATVKGHQHGTSICAKQK